MRLPRHILDRVDRVLDFHQATKLIAAPAASPDPANRPRLDQIFPDQPKTALPTNLIASEAPAISLMLEGERALAESHFGPPQDLRSLASWLYLASGRVRDTAGQWRRTCPSLGSCYPCEIYVAAFAIAGLRPGLYHYSPREFSLRCLCYGHETLAHLKRGRPDLDFLKTTPAALLISTVFSRSSWGFGKRGYRTALLDAGQLVANCSLAAAGLGMQSITRLQLNAQAGRELIGVPEDAGFIDEEAVQAMVIWTDRATAPLPPPPGGWATLETTPLPPLPRQHQKITAPAYGSILAVHADCVMPGVAVRDIRPPVTEISPLAEDVEREERPLTDEPPRGLALGRTMLSAVPAAAFERHSIARDTFTILNRVAFRGGSAYPLFPDGLHPALVRPFWIIHDITGLDPGIWYYHAASDRWSLLSAGRFRNYCKTMTPSMPALADASAIALLCANFRLITSTGPDAYRLAHLEAGMLAQRGFIAAHALGLSCTTDLNVFDEQARQLLGIERTGWEIIHAIAIGSPSKSAEDDDDDDVIHVAGGADWRD